MEKKDSKWTAISEGIIQTSMPIVPIVWYGASTSRFAQGDLPMNGLAELSIQHYNLRSDLQELLHKCAMPVPVRKGGPVGPDGRPAALVLGPNTAVDLPETGDFNFAEPTGKSLERHQAEIAQVEGLMDRSGLAFLRGTTVKTATEAALRASQVSSQVSTLVRNKTSAFSTIMRLWARYAGEACWKVRLTWASGRTSYDCYSGETGLLVASAMTQESPMGAVDAVTIYRDYTMFDGRLMPARMIQSAAGQDTELRILEVSFEEVPESRVAPPQVIRTLRGGQIEG
jgi:hypothetical protein